MSVLDRIFATKRREVEETKALVPMVEMERRALAAGPVRGFHQSLLDSPFHPSLIAEVKKASPSMGVIREDFDAADIARAYVRAGAATLSVLTDKTYFQGSPDYLVSARGVSGLPVLRKDFLDDPYQIFEARAMGADAVLLIVAALDDKQLIELHRLATGLGMDVLVEVHTQEEAERALRAECPLIGVNNRDLSDFKTSIEISERLIPLLAPHALVVSESALGTRADLDRVSAAGARAVLIGTAFCAAPNVEAAVRAVMQGQSEVA